MSVEERLTALEKDVAEIKEVLQEIMSGTYSVEESNNADLDTYLRQQIGLLQQEDTRLAGLITTNANSISELQAQISSLETNLSNTQQSIPKLTMNTKTKTLNVKNIEKIEE